MAAGTPLPPTTPADERPRRWRLVLGGEADGTGRALHGRDAAMDGALAALYRGTPRRAGPGSRAPGAAPPAWAARPRRWPAGWATSASTSRPPSSS